MSSREEGELSGFQLVKAVAREVERRALALREIVRRRLPDGGPDLTLDEGRVVTFEKRGIVTEPPPIVLGAVLASNVAYLASLIEDGFADLGKEQEAFRFAEELIQLQDRLDAADVPPTAADLYAIADIALSCAGNLWGHLDESPQASSDSLNNLERITSWVSAVKNSLETPRAREAADIAEAAAEAARKSSGQAGDINLGLHYSKVATEEAKSANNLRNVAYGFLIAAVIAAIGIAVYIVLNHEEGIASQLFKFLATVPILAIGFWFAHESNTHRMVARRAKEVEVRLYTLDAFLAPLEPSQQMELRAEVGKSLLVGPLALSAGSEKPSLDAQAIIEKLIEKSS